MSFFLNKKKKARKKRKEKEKKKKRKEKKRKYGQSFIVQSSKLIFLWIYVCKVVCVVFFPFLERTIQGRLDSSTTASFHCIFDPLSSIWSNCMLKWPATPEAKLMLQPFKLKGFHIYLWFLMDEFHTFKISFLCQPTRSWSDKG